MGLSAENLNKTHLIDPLDLVQSCSCVQFVQVMTERVIFDTCVFRSAQKTNARLPA